LEMRTTCKWDEQQGRKKTGQFETDPLRDKRRTVEDT
jgi:hypothetical protein